MPWPDRYQLMRWHMWLAAFLLPLTLIFLLSGLLYTLGIEGRITKHSDTIELSSAYSPELVALKAVVLTELNARGMDIPHGEPVLKEKKGGYSLYWSDLDQSVTLQAVENPMQAELILRERNWLAQLMRIHRGEAGELLRLLSTALPLVLLLIYLSGMLLALGLPPLRRGFLLAFAGGTGVLLLSLLLS